MTCLFQGVSALFPLRVPFAILLPFDLRVPFAICSTRVFEKTGTAELFPAPLLKGLIPFIGRIVIAHGQVAATADRHQIINRSGTTLGLRDFMANMKIKHTDSVLAPKGGAFRFKVFSYGLNPYLFSKGLRNRSLGHYTYRPL